MNAHVEDPQTDENEQSTERTDILTRLAATNAATEVLLPGRHGDVQMEAPELNDGWPQLVERCYKPVATINLPEPMNAEEIRDWVRENTDHPGFDDFDFVAWEMASYIEEIVHVRSTRREFAYDVYEKVEGLSHTSVVPKEERDDLLEFLQEAAESGRPLRSREVEVPDPEDEEDDR